MKFEDKARLEELIDKYTIGKVLDALAEICGEKSEHIATSYDDLPLAKRWEDLAGRVWAVDDL